MRRAELADLGRDPVTAQVRARPFGKVREVLQRLLSAR